VAWGLTIDVVDDEIDPTHNPSWVLARQERDHLAKLKAGVAALRALFASESIVGKS
jgi:hypothetical protein